MRRVVILLGLFFVFPSFSGEKKDKPVTPPPANASKAANPQPTSAGVLKKMPIPFTAGSRFERLRLPRYDGANLDSYITMNYVEILSQDICYGETIYARILRPTANSQIRAQKAWFNANTGVMRSQGKVKVSDPRYEFLGGSMSADMNTGEYYITGPGKGFFNRKKARELKEQESKQS